MVIGCSDPNFETPYDGIYTLEDEMRNGMYQWYSEDLDARVHWSLVLENRWAITGPHGYMYSE